MAMLNTCRIKNNIVLLARIAAMGVSHRSVTIICGSILSKLAIATAFLRCVLSHYLACHGYVALFSCWSALYPFDSADSQPLKGCADQIHTTRRFKTCWCPPDGSYVTKGRAVH